MTDFLRQLPYAVMIVGGILISLYLSNLFYDYKIPHYLSRKLSHLAAAAAFILCPLLFTSFVWPFILTICMTGLLLYGRMFRPNTFRGVGGSGRLQAFAEVHFPGTGIILIGVLWGIYNQPWLAIVPLAFMGAGDGITGIVRARMYGKEMKGLWGSLAMLVVCLLLAYFIHPYWVGAIGAITATLVEKFTTTRQYLDDNATIPLVSGLVMALLILR